MEHNQFYWENYGKLWKTMENHHFTGKTGKLWKITMSQGKTMEYYGKIHQFYWETNSL